MTDALETAKGDYEKVSRQFNTVAAELKTAELKVQQLEQGPPWLETMKCLLCPAPALLEEDGSGDAVGS